MPNGNFCKINNPEHLINYNALPFCKVGHCSFKYLNIHLILLHWLHILQSQHFCNKLQPLLLSDL